MKEMAAFFERYEEEFFKRTTVYPSVSYSEKLNRELLKGEQDSSGWVRWQAVLQESPIDWELLEKEIGFELREEIKEYYSSYFFYLVNARIGNIRVYLRALSNLKDVHEGVIFGAIYGGMAFPERQCLEIGSASIDGDDGYSIFVDNETGKVFCQEFDTMRKIEVADSIGSMFEKMGG